MTENDSAHDRWLMRPGDTQAHTPPTHAQTHMWPKHMSTHQAAIKYGLSVSLTWI